MVQLRFVSVAQAFLPVFTFLSLFVAFAQPPERKVDPTFLHRHLPDVAAKAADVSTDSCQYKPLFGAGDPDTTIVRGVARFGEITVAPGGSSKAVSYPMEEQIYVIMEGSGLLHYGADSSPVRKHDFMYLPAGVEHSLANPSNAPLHLFVMGFKLPESAPPPPKLLIANYDDVKKQTGGRPSRFRGLPTDAGRRQLASATAWRPDTWSPACT